MMVVVCVVQARGRYCSVLYNNTKHQEAWSVCHNAKP